MKRHRGVGHDRFRPRRCDFEKATWFLHNLVTNEIQIPFLRLANHLLVGDGSLRGRIPINHAATAIDQTLTVKADKYLSDSGGVTIIKCVTLARPIARTAQTFELFDNDAAMLVLPVEDPPQEFFATEIVARFVLSPAQIFFHRGLGSDSCMIHSR